MAEKKSAAKPATSKQPGKQATPPKEEGRAAKPHELMLMSTAQNASAMEKFGCFGEVDVVGLIEALGDKVHKIQDGDMKPVEAMLYGQAQALQAIFTNMARRSAINAGEYINASETYMKLALKAQSQCRATLETLAIVKNPMPYIRQANIANGPQQVNNATHAKQLESQPNELLEDASHERLDTGTTPAATRCNPAVETVAAVHRAAKPRRQGHGGT